MPTIDRVH